MNIHKFTFNPFQENTYLIEQNGQAIIVDPGMLHDHEFDELNKFIDSRKLQAVAIVNTHCHIDHMFGVNRTIEEFNIPFYAHSLENDNIKNGKQHAAMFGVMLQESFPEPHGFIDSLIFPISNWNLQLLFLPGHSPGHIGIYNSQEHWLISGDVIFKESIGRTDLPGGDFNTLEKSIKERIYTLPDHTIIYAGHMENTSVLNEKRRNPFVSP